MRMEGLITLKGKFRREYFERKYFGGKI